MSIDPKKEEYDYMTTYKFALMEKAFDEPQRLIVKYQDNSFGICKVIGRGNRIYCRTAFNYFKTHEDLVEFSLQISNPFFYIEEELIDQFNEMKLKEEMRREVTGERNLLEVTGERVEDEFSEGH